MEKSLDIHEMEIIFTVISLLWFNLHSRSLCFLLTVLLSTCMTVTGALPPLSHLFFYFYFSLFVSWRILIWKAGILNYIGKVLWRESSKEVGEDDRWWGWPVIPTISVAPVPELIESDELLQGWVFVWGVRCCPFDLQEQTIICEQVCRLWGPKGLKNTIPCMDKCCISYFSLSFSLIKRFDQPRY